MTKSKSKKVSIPSLQNITKKSSSILEGIVDDWVDGGRGQSAIPAKTESHISIIPSEKTKPAIRQLNLIDESRFTIVIPSYLHTRIKKHCVVNSVHMKALLTEILLKEFPER